jgi:ribosome-binding factor A
VNRRLERVGDQVRDELNRLLLRELRDPRVQMASVSRVEVSADLQHARVAVSALGSDEERDSSIAALRHAAGFLRSRLAKSLQLRATPALDFHLDRGAEHSLHISQLLEDLDVEGT